MSDDNKKVQTLDEVKNEIVEKYGFDAEEQAEVIEKLATEKLETQTNYQKELSKAIDKKAEYRQKLVDAGLIDAKTFEPIAKADDKQPEGEPIINPNGLTKDDVEKMFLANSGMDEEAIQQLDFIRAGAKVGGQELTYAEAQKNPLFIAYKATKDLELKSKKSQLGSGGGAGGTTKKVMTPEEHKEYAKEKAKELLQNL